MLVVKNILKERYNGLFLLLLAGIILFGFSINSRHAESQNDQSAPIQEQVLGETDTNSEEINPSNEIALNTNETDTNLLEKVEKEIEKDSTTSDVQVSALAILKNHLKKYCDKNYNKKKCKNYCADAKNNKQYKDLYKKYCENETDEEKTIIIVPEEKVLTLDFIINSGSEKEKFTMEFREGETVYELMKEAKAQGKMTYEKNIDETYGVYINEINGIKEGSGVDWTQNKYWILYVSGKSSSLGCSGHKLNKSDASVEWKYEKYSF